MSYYVVTQGKNNMTLFLVDRKKNKKAWWTYNLFDAMEFIKERAADYSTNRLFYNNPRVINSAEAQKLENENDLNYSEHPFSSDALGQE